MNFYSLPSFVMCETVSTLQPIDERSSRVCESSSISFILEVGWGGNFEEVRSLVRGEEQFLARLMANK